LFSSIEQKGPIVSGKNFQIVAKIVHRTEVISLQQERDVPTLIREVSSEGDGQQNDQSDGNKGKREAKRVGEEAIDYRSNGA